MNECVAVRSPLCPIHRLIKIKVPCLESKIASYFLFLSSNTAFLLVSKNHCHLGSNFSLRLFSHPRLSIVSDHLPAKGIYAVYGAAKITAS